MSILVGAISLSQNKLDESVHRAIRARFKFPGWIHNEFLDPNVVIMNATLSLFGTPDWYETEAGVAAIAGRLFHTHSEMDRVESLAERLLDDVSSSFLRSANGTFVVLAYDKKRMMLRLASDSLGGRPLYYSTSERYLVFSTSLDVLRDLGLQNYSLDIRAYAEQQAVCYPLADRTVFGEVKLLTDNQLLTVRNGEVTVESYFDWSDLSLIPPTEATTLAREAAAAVKEAVRVRTDTSRETEVSLLSGGLDSRVIVSELVRNGRPVRALNLSRRGYQDDVFASQYAQLVGITLERSEWNPLITGVTAGETSARMLSAAVAPLSQGVAFSGDGGGETLGFLLIEPSTCRLLSAGMVEAAVDDHLHSYLPPRRLLRRKSNQQMQGVAQQRMIEDLLSRGTDYQKALHRSVLLNDLRCHLHEYYNRIDRSKVELLLPFYDRRVVESVLRIGSPLDELLYHRFYAQVLEHLGADIQQVSWQVYPGRSPSPVAPDRQLPDQWSSLGWELGDELAARLHVHISRREISRHIRLPILRLALLLHQLRIRNFTSSFKLVVNLSELDLSPSGDVSQTR